MVGYDNTIAKSNRNAAIEECAALVDKWSHDARFDALHPETSAEDKPRASLQAVTCADLAREIRNLKTE